MARQVQDIDKEAECYQQIANIYEAQGQMENAIDYLNRFLEVCIQSQKKPTDKNDKSPSVGTEKLGLAYKRLSEVESKNGNTAKAIEYLGKVLSIANQNSTRSAQAEATLGLGLLFNQEGKEHNIKRAADYLQNHFDLLR